MPDKVVKFRPGSREKSMTVSIHQVRHAVQGARIAGFDINRLMRKSDIDPALLDEGEARIPLERYLVLSRYVQGVMNDEISGLLERPVRLGNLWVSGLLAVHSRTLGQALERMAQCSNLFENSLKHELGRDRNQAEFVVSRRADMRVLNELAIHFVLIFTHRFAGWLTNERLILSHAMMDFRPPRYGNEFTHAYYGAPVLFGQKHNAIAFDAGYLDRPVVQNETTLEGYVRRAPMDMFLPLDAQGPLTRQVRDRIQRALARSRHLPGFDAMARSLGFHPQTLRRGLAAEGNSYQSIKAQARRDVAIHHLGNSDLSIEAVSHRAGYTEPSTFIRAFKGWTGFTPAQFRRGLEVSL